MPPSTSDTKIRQYSSALRLWASVPPDLAGKLRPLADLLVKEILREIQERVDVYSLPLDSRFRDTLMFAIQTAVHQCFDANGRARSERPDWQAVFRHVGEAEFLTGRPVITARMSQQH